jgi:hypothetical protein
MLKWLIADGNLKGFKGSNMVSLCFDSTQLSRLCAQLDTLSTD